MRFDDLLSRADDETLFALLGNAPMRLLQQLDPGLATPARVRELAIGLYGRDGLLLNRKQRNLLFDLLKLEDARQLATIIGLDEEPYNSLKSASFRRDSESERNLFNYFEVAIPENETHVQARSEETLNPRYALFKHQRDAAREVQAKLSEWPFRVVLHMPTGAGKTRTAMHIVAEHLRRSEPKLVLWLAHTEELCEQAASEFARAWDYLGNREVSLHRFWGAHALDPVKLSDGLVVAGLAKMYSSAKQSIQFIATLADKTSLVIIDEAHSAIADTYKLILDVLIARKPRTGLLGLTATPGRTWADITIDEKLANYFGRRKVTLRIDGYDNPVDYLVDDGYLARVTYRPLYHDGGPELTRSDLKQITDHFDIPDRILIRLAEDEIRNLRIVTEVERLAKQHQRILIFAATVQHSELLSAVLRLRGLLSSSVTSMTPGPIRGRTIEEFRRDTDATRVLCNFGVLTAGFDAPRTSAALIARPTKSLVLYSQMVGRAIRGPRAGGNKEAEIVTVVDRGLPGFGSVAEAFNNWEDVWS